MIEYAKKTYNQDIWKKGKEMMSLRLKLRKENDDYSAGVSYL